MKSILHQFSYKNKTKCIKSDSFRDKVASGGRGSDNYFTKKIRISFLRPETIPQTTNTTNFVESLISGAFAPCRLFQNGNLDDMYHHFEVFSACFLPSSEICDGQE